MTSPASLPSEPRRAAIDWLRGLVMILMALDHASLLWNGGRLAGDSIYLSTEMMGRSATLPSSGFEPAQFFTRWISHLCAPTFLFLSGTSLAMSLAKRRAAGASESTLDRHLLIRAGVVLACEGLLIALGGAGRIVFLVLFAIGLSMIAMVALRRLPTGVLLAMGGGWLIGSEWVIGQLTVNPLAERPLWEIVLLLPGLSGPIYIFYPITHWLAMMILGWCFGRFLLALPNNEHGSQQAEKLLLLSGMTALLVWAYVRSANAYGNMGLLRESRAIIDWLYMSKYPPALVFTCMELGLMALILVAFMRYERRLKKPVRLGNPLLVFGQTALFFYVLHFILLGSAALAITGGLQRRGLEEAYIAAGVALVVLYPACLAFRRLKRARPKSVLQYF